MDDKEKKDRNLYERMEDLDERLGDLESGIDELIKSDRERKRKEEEAERRKKQRINTVRENTVRENTQQKKDTNRNVFPGPRADKPTDHPSDNRSGIETREKNPEDDRIIYRKCLNCGRTLIIKKSIMLQKDGSYGVVMGKCNACGFPQPIGPIEKTGQSWSAYAFAFPVLRRDYMCGKICRLAF